MDKQNIRKVKAGQAVSAKHTNKLVANANRQLVGTPPIKVTNTPVGSYISTAGGKDWWIGEIDASAQALDYSDCHYYVKRQLIISSDFVALSGSDFSDVFFPSDFVVTATNLPEISDNSHLLHDGQEVIVFEAEDSSRPPETVYLISESAWPIGRMTSDIYSVSDIRVSDITQQYRLRKESFISGLLADKSDAGWHSYATGDTWIVLSDTGGIMHWTHTTPGPEVYTMTPCWTIRLSVDADGHVRYWSDTNTGDACGPCTP